MNIGTFSGYIGKDAEGNHTQAGKFVANFSIGVNIGTKGNPKTLWVDCQVWERRGEALLPYLLKGTKVTASGRIDLHEYQRKDGTMNTTLRMNVAEIDLHGRKDDSGHNPRAAAAPERKSLEELSDEIPF